MTEQKHSNVRSTKLIARFALKSIVSFSKGTLRTLGFSSQSDDTSTTARALGGFVGEKVVTIPYGSLLIISNVKNGYKIVTIYAALYGSLLIISNGCQGSLAPSTHGNVLSYLLAR